MPAIHPATILYELATGVGIAIKRERVQSHIGVLYNRSSGEVGICHLGGHYWLLNRVAKPDYRWMNCPCFDDADEVVFIRARIEAIDEKTQVAYGFANDPHCFSKDFEVLPRPIGWGLTCASFVLAVFEVLGYKVLEYSTWQRREEDEAWQKMIVGEVAKIDQPQAEGMKKYIGSLRFRPEEFAAGATSEYERMPLLYGDAIKIPTGILQELESLENRTCVDVKNVEDIKYQEAAQPPEQD